MATLLWSRAGAVHPAVGLFSAVGAGIEVDVSPSVWPLLWQPFGSADHAPPEPDYVLTGAVEPPLAGVGEWSLTLFRTSDLYVVAQERRSFSEADAGDALSQLVPMVLKPLGSFHTSFERAFSELAGIPWEGLRSAAGAEVSLAKGQSGALLSLERCVSDAPLSVYPARRLGEVVAELSRGASQRDRERLNRILSRAMDIAPARFELLLAQASLRWAAEDVAGAVESLRIVTALAPGEFAGHHFMARAQRALGDWTQARASLSRAREIAPDETLLAHELSLHAVHDHDEDKAASAYTEVMRNVAAHDATLWTELARSAEIRGWRVLASLLVDHVLRVPASWSPELLGRAERLCLTSEPEGPARATRIGMLAQGRSVRDSAESGAAGRGFAASPQVVAAPASFWIKLRARLAQWVGR